MCQSQKNRQKEHICGELIHTNHNSVCLINIDLIIMKIIPQLAHY